MSAEKNADDAAAKIMKMYGRWGDEG